MTSECVIRSVPSGSLTPFQTEIQNAKGYSEYTYVSEGSLHLPSNVAIFASNNQHSVQAKKIISLDELEVFLLVLIEKFSSFFLKLKFIKTERMISLLLNLVAKTVKISKNMVLFKVFTF